MGSWDCGGVFGSKYCSDGKVSQASKVYNPVALVSIYYIMMIVIFINTIHREREREGERERA